ncbi:SDR family NAD(P)-dependent oxidoreductase [Actinomadura madurae]|nr:SDR family NAD(P)-dependent oxidoreductase [Actinomadura madurae]
MDLPETLDDRAGKRLAALVSGEHGEDQIALRASGAYARRLARAPSPDAGSEAGDGGGLRLAGGTVLITGGTGGLGAEVARWAARRGAAHLLLAGRRGRAAEGADALVAELEGHGAGVTVAACDVTDRDALSGVLASVPADRPLRMVVHAAGTGQATALLDHDPDEFRRVLSAKVLGARHLDDLLSGTDLAAFVMFSSIAAVWGSGQQAAYAAGNAYLDAIAERRRDRGLPGTSLAWGPWAETGMAAGGVAGHLSRQGLIGLPTRGAIAAMEQAIRERETGLVVADVDWGRFLPAFTVARPSTLFAGLDEADRADATAAGPGDPMGEDTELVRRLRELPERERRAAVLRHVRDEAGAVLGHAGAGTVEADRPLREAGFDSLTAVELRNRLAAATGLALPASLVFDHPTPDGLASFLLARLFDEPAGAQEGGADGTPQDDEPIAIVGMACRFPGGVASPEDLWEVVRSGGDVVGAFPSDRGWDLERLFGSGQGDEVGLSGVRQGGFLRDAAEFDAGFFGISPREALAMDPQQRLLLEVSWEVFERAGIDPSSMRGTRTGVFVGAFGQSYGAVPDEAPTEVAGYLATGNSGSVVSGRLAYVFGLEGPAVTVDTACSSSLVALHLAAGSLRSGESSLALAGGVTVMATPGAFMEFSRQGGLAADGRCKAFAEAADGVGWSEGVGLLLLERLSDARRNGRRILGVVRGSAVNQDGASNGLTAPNGPSQERVIREALAAARLNPVDVDAVEAHGTGTRLGDPIEAQALLTTYGQGREHPLWLGSIKSNIGHAQAAAGVAGVIKMVQAMRHGVLPRTLHVDAPSSHVDWSSGAVELLTEEREWPETGRPRRAGVSSFGISGTNAHVIVEAPPAEAAPGTGTDADLPKAAMPWVLSAKTPGALQARARQLESLFDAVPAPRPADVGLSLATTRALGFEHRAVLPDGGGPAARKALTLLAAGETGPGMIVGRAGEGRLAFLFAGQGAQRARAGRGLYDASPAFADALDEVLARFDLLLDRPLKPVLFAEPGTAEAEALERTEFGQPALFAVETALFRLLASLGVRPDMLAGHSVGEIAAAHAAGVLTLDDACALVAERGRLMGRLPAGGAMASIAASEDEVAAVLADAGDPADIAAVNGPASVVVSGAEEAVLAVAAAFADRGRRTKRLPVGHAFHSRLMEPMLEEFGEVVSGLSFHPARIPVFSDVSGDFAGTGEMRAPEYWVRHVREPVRFAAMVRRAAVLGAGAFLELGPDASLSAMARDCLEAAGGDDAGTAPGDPVCVPVLRKDRPEPETLTTALAELYVRGTHVDWAGMFAGTGACRVDLPGYPFQRRTYWLPARSSGRRDPAGLGLAPVGHPILAAMADGPDGGGTLTGLLSSRTQPWLADHVVAGAVLLPGTAFLDMVATAGARFGCALVEELTLTSPLAVEDGQAVRLRVDVGPPDGEGRRSVRVHARPAGGSGAGGWTSHATGTLVPSTLPERFEPASWPPPDAESLPVDGLYPALADAGLGYGPAFQGLRSVWRHGDEILAEVSLPGSEGNGTFTLHPALLDTALHPLSFIRSADGMGLARLPFSWSGVRIGTALSSALRVRLVPREGDTFALTATDGSGRVVIEAESLALRPLPERPGQGVTGLARRSSFSVDWPSVPAPAAEPGRCAVIGSGTLELLAADHHPDLSTLSAALDTGAPVPDLVLLPVADAPGGVADAARTALDEVLDAVHAWLADDRLARSRLVVTTRDAVAAAPDDRVPGLHHAPVWGLLRSAQSEHPSRFRLLDLDGTEASLRALPAALATGEPQLAVRAGTLHVPRLARLDPRPAPAAGPEPGTEFGAEGTVLITGGTGGIGRVLARHLVTAHGARRLLIVGPARRGARARRRTRRPGRRGDVRGVRRLRPGVAGEGHRRGAGRRTRSPGSSTPPGCSTTRSSPR